MPMINYADKVAVNANAGIPNINKCNASDMNEIKNAINGQLAQGWYKSGLNPTLTYVSYDAVTKTGVIGTNVDLTPYINAGMKLKFTQSSAIKFGKIVEITSTNMTVFFGTDYSLGNSIISDAYYSMLLAPYGFPSSDDKWTLIVTQTTRATTNTPSVGVLYDTGISLKIPKGKWLISVHCGIKEEVSPAGNITPFLYLTPNKSETYATATERDLLSLEAITGITLYMPILDIICIPRTITADKTYYLTYGVNNINTTYVQTIGDTTTTIIKAVCAY